MLYGELKECLIMELKRLILNLVHLLNLINLNWIINLFLQNQVHLIKMLLSPIEDLSLLMQFISIIQLNTINHSQLISFFLQKATYMY